MRPSPFKKQNPKEVLEARVRLAQPVEKVKAEIVRDGLEWLIRKRRAKFTSDREAAARFYRRAWQDALASGAPIASTLGSLDRVDASVRAGMMPAHVEASTTLMVLRSQVLRGQDDMLTVMDAVVGKGWTLAALVADVRGERDQLLAAAYEGVLWVALDLVHNWRLTFDIKSAHTKAIPVRASAECR